MDFKIDHEKKLSSPKRQRQQSSVHPDELEVGFSAPLLKV